MKKHTRVTIPGLFMILLVMGCAGSPKLLKQEDVKGIKRLAFVSSLSDKELQILDHTGHKQQSYTHGQYGAIGGLIEGIIAAGAAPTIHLGGDPDSLREAVSDFPIKEHFDENFDKVLSINFEILSPEDLDSLRKQDYPETEGASDRTIEDYAALYEKFGVDMVLEIDFVYGLATYRGGLLPSAVVSADVTVRSIDKNKRLMKKTISSDSYYKRGYTVDEFKADGAKLFKSEIIEALRGFSHIVASEFGVELSGKEKSFWGSDK